ncbi:MAG: Rossmann-like and DUF2520 domain-containing protein [Candidatus Sulfotelmatobacter sp.]
MKPRVAIVGAGNLASALAVALHGAGYGIDQIISRDQAASFRRARRLAGQVGASAVAAARAQIRADIVWFCVPDGAIAGAAEALKAAADWSGKVAVHSSGALTSDELADLQRRGAAVASVHPFMTFVRGSRPRLVGVPFAIEGDAVAVRMARRIVKNLDGCAYSIRNEDKAAYHTWGTFASPLLTALLVTSEHVAAAAGVKRKAAKQRMLPILKQTLANYVAFDAAGAFSGPLIRGDVDTVKRHLRTLRGVPVAQDVYVSLARAALAYLPGKNKETIETALKSLRRSRSRN